MKFSGVIPILVTPFNEDESIDLDSIATMIELMREIHVDGVTILGVLGEANRLTDEERVKVITTSVEVSGDLPVIVGTSAAGTAAVIEYNEIAKKHGASAVMVTPQKEQSPSDSKVYEHFKSILSKSELPVILQDHPASTGVHMSNDLMFEMLDNLPGFAGIKLEAVPTAPKLQALKQRYGDRFPIMTGLGALYGAFDLKSGSDGFNTGFAFPEVLQKMVSACQKGDLENVYRIYSNFLPLIVYEQQPGVGIRKELLKLRGAIGCSRVRSPGAQAHVSVKTNLTELTDRLLPGQPLTRPIKVS